ncbi:MAG: chemotaxis protein CheW [Cyanobacteria bacterium P01_D01_bin.56]
MQSSYCLFKINQRLSAIRADYLEEVFALPELILVPNAPSGIVGVVDFQGNVLPVVDFRITAEGQPRHYELTDSLMTLKQADMSVGIIIDSVHGVRELSTQGMMTDLAGHQTWMTADTKDFFAGLLLTEGNIFILDQPQSWFNPGELQQVIAITRSLVDEFYETSLGEDADTLSRDMIATTFCPHASEQEKTIFRQRADSLRQLPDIVQSSTTSKPLIVIALDNHLIGIDAKCVREFITVPQAIPVPCCPKHIIGNTNLRGEIVTIVDISEPLGFVAQTLAKNFRAVVVELGDTLAAVVIEDIRDALFALDPRNIKVGSNRHACIQGMVPYGEQIMHILDLPKLLNSDDLVVNQPL